MKAAIIGTGARSTAYVPLLKKMSDTAVTVLCDIDSDRLDGYRRQYFPEAPDLFTTTDYREALSAGLADTAFILTPDITHRPIFEEAVTRHLHILLEKPIATTLRDAAQMYRLGGQYDKTIALGFVLRYTPLYTTVKRLLEEGCLGKLISISACELVGIQHAASFFRRWHRFSVNNGGLMNAKCCHDLDILNWLADSIPERVSAFGGRSLFIPRADAPEHCQDCPHADRCIYAYDYDEHDRRPFRALSDLCVYNAQKDIVDHEIMNIRYENGIIAQFEMSLVAHEGNRHLTMRGSKATLSADFNASEIWIHPLGKPAYQVECTLPDGGHGGGDARLTEAIRQSVEGSCPINHVRAGYYSTLTALAGETSMKTGQTVCISEFIHSV